MAIEDKRMKKHKSEPKQSLMFTSISRKDLERICQDSLKLLLDFDTSGEIVFEEI